MATLSTTSRFPRHEARAAVERAKGSLDKLVRVGYAAKGAIYVVIGLLAAAAGVGSGGQTTGSRGAMAAIAGQPFGTVLLAVLAAGLAGYALWQFYRAAVDPEHAGAGGTDKKAWARRAGYAISGCINAGLVVAAVRLLTAGGGAGDDDANARGWFATLMSYGFGRAVLGTVGAGVVAFGVREIYRAYTADLDKQLDLSPLSTRSIRLARGAGRIGIAARGVVLTIVGGFLLVAALRSDPGRAKGLGGALDALAAQPYGPWLIAAVALGLVAYGAYNGIRARYRRVELA
ncbi:MAG TPA: DUF1206 domain-containing protein [Humisphaera sp.]